ncbi:MAG: rhodanese-like domain-containing protein [Gammaproteobacteria bacterium]|jgi:phage shock protein E
MLISASDMIAAAKSQCNCMDEVAAKLLFDKHDDAIILDVREAEEFNQACLIDSTNIPRGLLELKIGDLCDNPNRVILIHCAGGGRASLAASTLQTMGYSNVHVIDSKFEEIRHVFG